VDPVRNPYTPNAGATPPVLAGRDAELAAFDILLARLEGGRTEQSMIITGLRGVGKTVLLEEFRTRAASNRWVTLDAEISRSTPFGPRMAHLVRRGLLQLSPRARWDDRMTRAAGILRSFTITVSSEGTLGASLDVDAVVGLADSGDLAEDLTDLLVALGEAAQSRGTGVVFLFDELQFLVKDEFESLVAALHKTVQRALPITVVGAGLPLLPQLSGEAKSYAERLFRFPVIGHLTAAEAMSALVEPAASEGVGFAPDAAAHILAYTEGYPYFIQEYGKFVWDATDVSPITFDVALAAGPVIEEHLDTSFFRVRADRATDAELRYMRAMAELGAGAQRASDVAQVLGTATERLGPIRARLISKGLLYSPGYGLAAFTVPQFDRFLRRAHPNLLVDPASRQRS
jgi:hypothetical protein